MRRPIRAMGVVLIMVGLIGPMWGFTAPTEAQALTVTEYDCSGPTYDVWAGDGVRERVAVITGDAVKVTNDPESRSTGNVYADGTTLLGPAPVDPGASVVYPFASPGEHVISGGDGKVSVVVQACTIVQVTTTTTIGETTTTVVETTTTTVGETTTTTVVVTTTTVAETTTTVVVTTTTVGETTTTTAETTTTAAETSTTQATTTTQPTAETTQPSDDKVETREVCEERDGQAFHVVQELRDGDWVTLSAAPALACTGGPEVDYTGIVLTGFSLVSAGIALVLFARPRRVTAS